MTAALDSSYQALNPVTARGYRLLAICPGNDLTEAPAAAALGTDPATTRKLLQALVSASLLAETGEGRYRYHDLIRDHAQAKAGQAGDSGERSAAGGRVIDHYLRASAAADLPVLPHRLRHAPAFFPVLQQTPPAFTGPAAALAWTGLEIPNLLAAQQAAAATGLHTLAWQFADTLWGWIASRHDHRAWHQVMTTALACAQACGDSRAEALARTRLGYHHLDLGDHAKARDHIAAAVHLSGVTGNLAGEASAREHSGILHLAEDHPGHAIAEFEAGLACWQHAGGNPRGEAIIHRQAGRACAALGHHDQARRHLQHALDTFTELGEHYHQSRTLLAIAETCLTTEDPRHALTLLEQALALTGHEDAPVSQASIYITMARAHEQAGEHTLARSRLGRALNTYQANGIPHTQPAHAQARAYATRLGMLQLRTHHRGPRRPAGPEPRS